MHPAIKIIYLLLLAVTINFMHIDILLWFTLAMLILLVHYRAYSALHMIRRARWLFLSLALVYAFNTPGEYVHHWPVDFVPTYEGLIQGSLQILRIILLMAGLALLTATTSKQAMMVGFYQLLIPIKWLNLSPERFAARLWLTLSYAEQESKTLTKQNIIKRLERSYMHGGDDGQSSEVIEILIPKMRILDICMLILLLPLGYFVL